MPPSVSADALGVANGQRSLIDAEDCQLSVLSVSSSTNRYFAYLWRGSLLGRMTLLYSTCLAFHHISPCSYSWHARKAALHAF